MPSGFAKMVRKHSCTFLPLSSGGKIVVGSSSCFILTSEDAGCFVDQSFCDSWRRCPFAVGMDGGR